MGKTDLNIIEFGIQGSDWHEEDTGLTADSLKKVKEQKTDNSAALNSLPTPFSRFFVAREAFRRMTEEHVNRDNSAGFAYEQLVSDILDVYELLFNLKYHKNVWGRKRKIEIREWDRKSNMTVIKNKMPLLYNSIDNYYETDIREDKLYFIVYTEHGRDVLLACSSPMTGFVTPPDMDKALRKEDGVDTIVFAGEQYRNLHIIRKSGSEYFRNIMKFEDRDADFKNYMYNAVFGGGNLDGRFKAIKEYVRSFQNDPDIRNDYKLRTTPVMTDQNNPLVVNGLGFHSSDEVDVNSYFTDTLIRLPYRISREKFGTVTYRVDPQGRDYDYLLPFRPEVLALAGDGSIDSDIQVGRQSVTVFLRYNGEEYKKDYAADPIGENWGRIADVGLAGACFDLGVFPNILSCNDQENNYFKVMLMSADNSDGGKQYDISRLSLSFYRMENGRLEPVHETDPSMGAQFGVRKPVVRSVQGMAGESGSKFYELYNTAFDAVEVRTPAGTGLLLPKWERSKPTDAVFTYAIDLGTSNTFMSRCRKGGNLQPEMFRMDRPMVSYLHEILPDRQFTLAHRIEDSVYDGAESNVKTEFLPAVIDGREYAFPVRTAMCGLRGAAEYSLFDRQNIAFFYEKIMPKDNQEVKTDIKWTGNDDLLRMFVRELLLIVKCDILQHDGDMARTDLVWFRPLSFMGATKDRYERIWREEARNIMFIGVTQISSFTESEAPYYYFKKKNYIKNSDAVTVIDIGGGSTDFVYFKDNRPVMANSIHFGCDVLWENGFNDFANTKDNGIYKRYENTLKFSSKDLADLNDSFRLDVASRTKDIINFWLGNAGSCGIIPRLANDFKPVFAYHLTAILYYMASMYKDLGCEAPRTLLFSGNGSRYIDDFISTDRGVLKAVVDIVFRKVFGGEHNVNIELPEERKESTCYGGLYRDPAAEAAAEKVYQGDSAHEYGKVGDIRKNLAALTCELEKKYAGMNSLYKEVLDCLKQKQVLDAEVDTRKYVDKAEEDMLTPFRTYFKTQVDEKYGDDVILHDSVFFLPIVDRIFNMTKI